MRKIATPVSHLFKDKTQAFQIEKYSDCLEGRDHSPESNLSAQELFHCDLQPIHIFNESNFEYIETIKKVRSNLKLVSFHMASCYDQPEIEDGKFVPGGRLFTREEMKANVTYNIKRIKKILGTDILIAVENNNYYKTDAYNIVCDPDFIKEVVIENNIFFLFDIAHAHVSSANMGVRYKQYRDALPLENIVQVHICKSSSRLTEVYDAHIEPDIEEWNEIAYLFSKSIDITYFTIEYYKDPIILVKVLGELKDLLKNYE